MTTGIRQLAQVLTEPRGKPVAVGGSQQRGVVVNFIEGRGAARAATESVLALPRLPCSTGCGETARANASVQPGDQRRQELAQHRRPFSVLGAAGGMARSLSSSK